MYKKARIVPIEKGIPFRERRFVSERPKDLKKLFDWGIVFQVRLSEVHKFKKVLLEKHQDQYRSNPLVDYIQGEIKNQCKVCNIPPSVSPMCSLYIATTISIFLIKGKDYVDDFIPANLKESSRDLIRKNANTCFLMHAVFKGNKSFPITKLKLYEEVGKSWYEHLRKVALDPVDDLMNKHFEKLSEATRRFIRSVGVQ